MKLASFKAMLNKMDNYIKLNRGGVSLYWEIRYGMGIVWNYIFYKATISDYFELRFFEKSRKEKQRYLTSKQGLYFAQYVDPEELFVKLCSKTKMYQELKEFTKREQLFSENSSKEQFYIYVRKHPTCLYKPDNLDCGKGIEKWEVLNENIEDFYIKFKREPAVLDELVVQHPAIAKLNPSSVNTIRIFTLMIEKKCELIGASLRIGKGNTIIDNYSAGGLVGAIDLKTGVLINDAEDAIGKRYSVHPVSKIKIKGFQIPNWEKVIAFVQECAADYPLKYVAWDIAVRENDCVLIEANPNGMANVIQIAGAGGRKAQYESLKKKLEQTRR